MAQGRVKIGVGFDVDKSGLNELKSSLVNLQNATKLDVFNTSTTKKELAEIQQSANQVAAALNKSYNAKLGTYNIEAFKKEINATTGGLSALQQQWSKVATGERAFRNLANSLTSTNLELKETHSLLDSMGTTLMNTIKWSIASTAVNTVTGSIQKAWSFTKQLDESLTNIMIVTEKSSDQMAAFARQANTAAKALGASTKAYSDAALIYYQQGLGDDEVISRTNTTLKAANVTGQNAAQVSEQLTAVWNGYKVATQETELYVDKLSAVAATTAADLEELSTGMSKVASAANTMGVDIDQLNAQLATVISVTRQAPESVGTAFKTIFARMGDIEAGLDTETTLGEYTSQMEAMGFHVLDANNQLRDQGEVIEEIGAKWKSLSREQQIALAQTMAGTRQYNNLLALFDNWGMYEKALQTSANAAGTLSQQNEEYLDSLEAKMQQLTTTAEDLYLSLFDSDSFKDGIDLLTKGVDVLGQFVESVGGGGTVLLSLGTIMTRVFSKQISQSIATTATNFINAKQNAEALAVTMQNIKEISKLDDMDEATKRIISMKEHLVALKQAGLVTNEEFAELTAQIQEFSNAADEASMIKERANQYDKQLKHNATMITREQKRAKGAPTANPIYLADVLNEANAQKAGAGLNPEGNKALEKLKTQMDALKLKAEDLKLVFKDDSSMQEWSVQLQQNLTAIKENTFVEQSTIKEIESIQQELNKIKNTSTSLDRQIAETERKLKTSIDNADRGEKLNAKLKELKAQRQEIEQTYQTTAKKLNPLWNKVEKETNTVAENIKKTGQDLANGAAEISEDAVHSIQNSFKKIDLTQAIQKVVNFTSAVGSAVGALQILGNFDDIWSNEDLSTGEKMTQTIMNVASAAGMLLPAIQGITTWRAKSVAMLKAENIEQAKKQILNAADFSVTTLLEDVYEDLTDNEKKRVDAILAETKALNNNTSAELNNLLAKKKAEKETKDPTNKDIFSNKIGSIKKNFGEGMQGFKGTWSKIKGFNAIDAAKAGAASAGGGTAASIGSGIAAALPYAAVLAAIVTSIAVSWSNASKKNKEEQKAWEQTSTAAESAQKRLNEVNAEWDNLESSLDALDNGTKALDELTKGTVEWQKALADVNNQVIELLNKYPELAQYVTRDASTGQLGISATGQAIIQQKQLEELQNAQASSALANLEAASAKQDKLLNDLIDQNSDGDILGPAAMAGSMAAAGAIIGTVVPGIGNAIGAIVGAGIGAVAGIATAAATSSAIDAAEEAEKKALQENPTFIAAMEAYVTHGDKIYESEEALSKALGDVENKDIELIKELAENSKQTKALAEAYTQAKAVEYDQKVALGASILGENAAKGAQYIAGDQASLIPEEFKEQLRKELSGGNDKDEALAREWARLTGISNQVASIDTKGKNKVVVKNAKGETLGEYDAESLITEVTQLRWQEGQKAKGNAEAVSTWQNISGLTNDQEIENALSQVITGAAGASFESLTKTDFEKLQKVPEDKLRVALERYAKAVDEKSSIIFERFDKSIKASGELWARMAESMPQAVGDLFTSLTDGLDFTASEGQKFANIVATLANNFGAANATDFLNIIAGLGESDQEDLISVLGGVDWANIAAKDIASTVTNLIDNADIEIGLAEQDKIIRALELVANGRYSIEALQEQYRNLQELLKDVADDGKISAEVYANLTDKQKEYFTVLSDGSAILTKATAQLLAGLREDQINKWATTLSGALYDVYNKGKALEENEGERLGKLAEYYLNASTPPISKEEYDKAVANSDWDLTFLNSTDSSLYQRHLDQGKSPLEAAQFIFDARSGAFTTDYKNKFEQALTGLRNEQAVQEYELWARNLNKTNDDTINSESAEKAENLREEREQARHQLEDIVKQIYQESGGGATFTALLDQLRNQSPELASLIDTIVSSNQRYLSETQREVIASNTDDAVYANWIRMGADPERIGTIEAENVAYEKQQRIIQKLQDEFDNLTGAEKLNNLTEQAQAGEASLKDLENALISIENAGLDPLRNQIDNSETLFSGVSYATDEDGEYTDPIRKLLSRIGSEAYTGNISKDTLASILEISKSASTYGLDQYQIEWLNTIATHYEELFTKIEAQEDLIANQRRTNYDIWMQKFEESTAQLNDYYDTQIDYLETSISLLDHQVELNKLINGEDSVSVDQLEKIAEAREEIYKQRKAELVDQSLVYLELAADDISAEANEIRNQYYQAAQDAAQAEIEMIQAYTDANTAAVTNSIEEILGTSLSALAKLKEEADWTATMGDRYLSERDKAFGLDTLKYTYGQAARENVDLKVREEINALLDQELEALEAKDALTQADLDRAYQQLEILKARIALERAEQDMSNMRLVRGANGEYSYQFVANPAARAEAEQKYREEVEKGRQMNEEALNASTNNTYEAITSLTDYLKEATEGGINEQEGRHIEALVGEISRAASRIKGDLDAVGADLGIDTTQKDWWLDEANQVLLRTEGFVPEWIDALMKGEYDKLDADTLTQMSEGQLNDLFSKVLGDEWQKIIDAANEDAKNAAENMVGPDYLKGQIDRVVEALGLLSQGKEIPKQLWADENDAASGAPKAPAAPEHKPVITRIDGTRIESAIRGGIATTVSNFEGMNNRVHLTPVDTGKGVIEQKVEIVANFPDATDRDEIKAAFDDLIGLAVQHANQNVKGK